MSGQNEDFALGPQALLGRAIGEVSGLQRRISTLERDIYQLQERLEAKPTRGEFAFYLFGLILIAMMFAGTFVVLNLWWMGKISI